MTVAGSSLETAADEVETGEPAEDAKERLPAAAVLLSLALAAEIFSGNWGNMGMPGAVDRVLIVLGLGAVVLGGQRAMSDLSLRLRPIHILLLVAATYATVSSIAADTFGISKARFALLDRFGLIPFVLFCLAPIVYRRARARRFLLGTLIVVGAYIGLTNLFESLGITALVFPKYISDPNVGLHFGRARGPFVEAVADGLSLYMCGVAAAIGLTVWKKRWVQSACILVIGLAGLGILLTVTRAVWVAAVAGTLAVMLVMKPTRRYVLPAVAVGALGVFLAFQLVPGLQSKADTRIQDERSVWDRYNTNSAALRIVEAHPLFGVGWQTFPAKGADYMRQADTYPLTGATLEVHNVFLSHAAELGLVGSLLWSVALFAAVGGAIVRRGPPELAPWRAGLLAVFIAFLVVANFGPLSYPLPNALLWTWAGIAGGPFFLAAPRKARADAAATQPEPAAAAISSRS